jgi:8-oxo-dGTP pyrophosphatase MutT (NUDIX family)
VDLDDLIARLAEARPETAPGDPDHRQAAVAIVLRPASDGPHVLLMQRAVRPGDRWSGQIGLPGGHAEPVDADLVATARRETSEEVHVDLERDARLIGQLATVQAKARGRLLPMAITPFVFVAERELEPHPGPEADAVFWFPLGRARSGELAATHRYRRETEERVLPAWRFEERVVWGLTFEILSRFLALAFR